ncbi:hypothetical protein [Butyrivibrio sp. AE2032]|uniref:hypothetical protein n=1 Tax=Butyrivibrio sp. AE2032 TaxID=1458463 RepID=UPI000551CBDD|nr:hypothetical protein [Butyrivibrio sp. AE2032]
MKVEVGQWSWQFLLDRINKVFSDSGISTIMNLDYSGNSEAKYSDIPNGHTPTAILESKNVWRQFDERNGMQFEKKKVTDGKVDIIHRHYGFMVVPEEYLFTFKLFTEGSEGLEEQLKKLVANFNNGCMTFSVKNPYDETEPSYLGLYISFEKAVRVSTTSQFSDIIKTPIHFKGSCYRILSFPTEPPKNDFEIGDYLGIVQGLKCIESVFSKIDSDVDKLNQIQNYKKKTLFMPKEIATLGSQYISHQQMDRQVFEQQIVMLPFFYPNLYDEISAGKKVQGIEELKNKLKNRYTLVHKKAMEVYELSGFPMKYYGNLDLIIYGLSKYGTINEAINYTIKELKARDALARDMQNVFKGAVSDMATTAKEKYDDIKSNGRGHYKGMAACAMTHGDCCSSAYCKFYYDCLDHR